MADWYVSSVAYAAVTQWAPTTAYTVGQLRRPLVAQLDYHQYVFRCTTAGTSGASEPNWSSTAVGNTWTITDGTVVWTNVSGQSAYNWSAPFGTLYACVCNASTVYCRAAPGDRIFVSSDHTETNTNLSYGMGYGGAGGSNIGLVVQVYSVNRAGSVPPVAADIKPGASVFVSGSNAVMWFMLTCDTFFQGITFGVAVTSGGSQCQILFNNGSGKVGYLKDCALKNLWNGSMPWAIGSNASAKIILDNTPITFANAGQSISAGSGPFDLTWINTPNAVQGTMPTALFNMNGGWNPSLNVVCRGVDLSAVSTALVSGSTSAAAAPIRVLLDSCKIASAVTRLIANGGEQGIVGDEIELVNCYDGVNVINERNTYAGKVSTDRSTYLSNGAQDDIGNYSLKLVSNTRSDKFVMPLDCFAFDVENVTVGALKTATIELVSSVSLNNDDIQLLIEHMGTPGDPTASLVNSLLNPLTPVGALPVSGVTWTSPPATPVKQLLQATFTPQRAGRVRGLVRLGKPSATTWVNPQITIANSPYSATAWQFLSRTGGLDSTHSNAYAALIDGLVTDGIWSKLDVLHIYATQDAANATLNLVSNNYGATVRGAPTFTVNRGFTGVDNSTTMYIDTGFNGSTAPGAKYSTNNAHLSIWNLTNTWTFQAPIGINNTGPGNGSQCWPQDKGSGYSYPHVILKSGGIESPTAPADIRGHWVGNRSASNARQGYQDAVLRATGTGGTSIAPHNQNIYTLGTNTDTASKGCASQLAMASIGSSLSQTDVTNYYNRLRTYMTAVGVP